MFHKKNTCVKKIKYTFLVVFFYLHPLSLDAKVVETCPLSDAYAGSHTCEIRREASQRYTYTILAKDTDSFFSRIINKFEWLYYYGFLDNAHCRKYRDRLIKSEKSLTKEKQMVELYRGLLISKEEILEIYMKLQAELYKAQEEITTLKAKNEYLEKQKNCTIN